MTVFTVTPNPALDLSGKVQDLVPNEKNYVHSERRDPGGNGINAARIAHRLGARAVALGFLGGQAGAEVARLLKAEGVSARFTPIQGNTRVNVTVSNEATHQQTRLTFPGPRVSPGEVRRLIAAIGKFRGPGILILGGSLPPGCPADFHARLGRAGAARGLGVVIDVPAKVLGRSLRGLEPLFLKPNRTELEEWSGKPLADDDAVAAAGMRLARHAALVCVSLAERGALLCTRDRAWQVSAPKIRARGTVGAGDSMVGAMAARLARAGLTTPDKIRGVLAKADGDSLPSELFEVIRWGVAAGAATAEVSGTSLARPSEIRRLTAKVRVARAFR